MPPAGQTTPRLPARVSSRARAGLPCPWCAGRVSARSSSSSSRPWSWARGSTCSAGSPPRRQFAWRFNPARSLDPGRPAQGSAAAMSESRERGCARGAILRAMTVPRDFEHRYRAVASRDPRFDGYFFLGVTSTGIYCRPSCPARTPRREHVRFYPTAAAAQAAGFRACKRCIPGAVPGSPEWDVRGDVAGRAMRLIADGVVEREGVPGLAGRLGYGERQLRRILLADLGATPLAEHG